MIIQQFNSGLGNQMFQYVFFRSLMKHHPDARIRADLTWFDWNDVHQGYELKKLFGISVDEAKPGEILAASGQLPVTFPAGRYFNRLFRIFDKAYIRDHCIDEISPDEMVKLDGKRNLYLTGFFISEKYYREDLEDIRRIFSFREAETVTATAEARRIQALESISIHVRRGDYLDPVYKDRFDLLRDDYYKAAVSRMREFYSKPHFFIFSDDKDFINGAFEWLQADERTIVTGNTGADSWKDMFLMSLCRGNILANSTFSTWGALLGRPEGRHVIYPRAYISGQDSEKKTIEGWERL